MTKYNKDFYKDVNVINGMKEVYGSWLADKILNFNSDLYYESRDYIAKGIRQRKIK